jgi:hypothetical protein
MTDDVMSKSRLKRLETQRGFLTAEEEFAKWWISVTLKDPGFHPYNRENYARAAYLAATKATAARCVEICHDWEDDIPATAGAARAIKKEHGLE